jgi:phosphatidylglycerol:prolipoprotein diacylglycerol transferase
MKSVAIQIGPLAIHWYSLMILSGIIGGIQLAKLNARRWGEDPEHIYNIALYGTLLAIVCARAYYVAFQWNGYYKDRPIEALYVWHGGLAIHGAVIGAIAACSLYCWHHKLDILKFFDLSAPALLLGQVIGRWGNFFNREAYGSPAIAPGWWPEGLRAPDSPALLPWGLAIDPEHRIPPYTDIFSYPAAGPGKTYFHPTFLYESLWDLLGLIVIVWLMRRFALPKGNVLLMYFVVWGTGRLWVEALRTDPLTFMAFGQTFRIAQLMSILLATGGLLAIAIRAILDRRRAQQPPNTPLEAQP